MTAVVARGFLALFGVTGLVERFMRRATGCRPHPRAAPRVLLVADLRQCPGAGVIDFHDGQGAV